MITDAMREPAVRHEEPGWAVEALAERAEGRLTVVRYEIDQLPAERRIARRQDLRRQRQHNRLLVEERAVALCAFLRAEALRHGCHKVSLLAPQEHVPHFCGAGLGVEAVVEECFRGQEPRYWLADFPAAVPPGHAPPVAPGEAVQVRSDWSFALLWLGQPQGAALAGECLQRARELAGQGVQTVACLVSPEAEAAVAALPQAGYRYRGLLGAHSGAQDLMLWARSTADLQAQRQDSPPAKKSG